jgi:hypothetical protein
VQEQQQQIEELEKRNNSQQKLNEELLQRIVKLESTLVNKK